MSKTDDEVKAALSDFSALWLTLWAEARGEPIEGQVAVGCVIRNRVNTDLGHDGKPDWWGEGYKGVCLAPSQFSCWRAVQGAANYTAVMALARREIGDFAERTAIPLDAAARQVKAIAENLMNGNFLDRTHGATQYLTLALYRSHPPAWAGPASAGVVIGSQIFFP